MSLKNPTFEPDFHTRKNFESDKYHYEHAPHWSVGIEWRHGRWDPMNSAPSEGRPILHIRGRDHTGRILEPMHYAYGGGEEQPYFRGWFIPMGEGFIECQPVEWQPLYATY